VRPGPLHSGADGRGSLTRAGRWLSRTLLEPEYPLLAVEVRPAAVAAVRLAREGGRLALGAAGVVDLDPGTIDATLTRPNILDRDAFLTAVRSALERVGALEPGPVSLVLPDPALRLALVSSEGLRRRSGEANEMIRFRLHKALPFDVRAARLAWEPGPGDQVLVAVALDEVVDQYEGVMRELGFHPGLVEAASLALLSASAEGPGDRLLVNWDDGYVSFVLVRDGRPILVRTLAGESEPASVARQATSTLQFLRDRLGGSGIVDAAVRSASCPVEVAQEALAPVLGLVPRPIEPWAALGEASGPIAQGLAGAAACALRRAA